MIDLDAPEGTLDWALLKASEIRRLTNEERINENRIRRESARLRRDGSWKLIKGPWKTWDEFAAHRDGLDGGSTGTLTLLLGEARAEGPLAGHGEIGKGRPKDRGRVDNVNSKGGNRGSYLARRLLRDAPEVFRALEKGGYPSVRQAAIAAGIVKVPTPLERAKKAYARLGDAEKDAFLTWIGGRP